MSSSVRVTAKREYTTVERKQNLVVCLDCFLMVGYQAFDSGNKKAALCKKKEQIQAATGKCVTSSITITRFVHSWPSNAELLKPLVEYAQTNIKLALLVMFSHFKYQYQRLCSCASISLHAFCIFCFLHHLQFNYHYTPLANVGFIDTVIPLVFVLWPCTAIRHHLRNTTIQANKPATTLYTIAHNRAWKVFHIASITYQKIGMLLIDRALLYSPMAKDVAQMSLKAKEEMGINIFYGFLHTLNYNLCTCNF